MGFLQLVIAAVAVYLFLLFLAQPFLFVFRTLPRLLSPKEGPLGSATEMPDDVDPMPLEDLNQVFFAIELGRDRFGRMVYKGYDHDGGYKFYHYETGLRRVRDIRSVPLEELENWDALHGRV
jgi:hypothetical protein